MLRYSAKPEKKTERKKKNVNPPWSVEVVHGGIKTSKTTLLPLREFSHIASCLVGEGVRNFLVDFEICCCVLCVKSIKEEYGVREYYVYHKSCLQLSIRWPCHTPAINLTKRLFFCTFFFLFSKFFGNEIRRREGLGHFIQAAKKKLANSKCDHKKNGTRNEFNCNCVKRGKLLSCWLSVSHVFRHPTDGAQDFWCI